MKKNNPYVPILMREAAGTEPKVFARYGAFVYFRRRFADSRERARERERDLLR